MTGSVVLSEQWQCGKTLPECLGYMLDNEVSCDIAFLLGEQCAKVKAHKTLLIARSPVFYAMLDGPLKEKDAIEIPDIDTETFKILLKFIYTDTVDLTADNVMSVLYASKKYCLESLSNKCIEFLEDNLSDENACLLYEQSHLYDEKDLHDKCFKHISYIYAEKCLKDEYFLDLCPTCCDSLISSDDLGAREELVYEAVLKWADRECQKRDLDITNGNRRKILGNLLYKVRFPLINNDYFAKNIFNDDLLSDKEKLAVAPVNHYQAYRRPENIFNSSRRSKISSNFEERVIRFQSSGDHWMYDIEPDTICFYSSDNIFLHGVVLYGDKMSSSYTVHLSILDDQGMTKCSIEREYSADPISCLSDILLEKPILITKDKTYKITAFISGPGSIRGTLGEKTVYFNSTKLAFSATMDENNGTDYNKGQIPGLLLSSA